MNESPFSTGFFCFKKKSPTFNDLRQSSQKNRNIFLYSYIEFIDCKTVVQKFIIQTFDGGGGTYVIILHTNGIAERFPRSENKMSDIKSSHTLFPKGYATTRYKYKKETFL